MHGGTYLIVGFLNNHGVQSLQWLSAGFSVYPEKNGNESQDTRA